MTTARTRKKLIEVALPLDAINTAAAREKSIRHGHPSTLHLWWAAATALSAPIRSCHMRTQTSSGAAASGAGERRGLGLRGRGPCSRISRQCFAKGYT